VTVLKHRYGGDWQFVSRVNDEGSLDIWASYRPVTA
jgi:hypothetical protein